MQKSCTFCTQECNCPDLCILHLTHHECVECGQLMCRDLCTLSEQEDGKRICPDCRAYMEEELNG